MFKKKLHFMSGVATTDKMAIGEDILWKIYCSFKIKTATDHN